jgi:hypothetical protein
MNLNTEICRALFVLHQIKVGPSKLVVKKKNLMLQNVFALETRALSFLAGYGETEDPQLLLQEINSAVKEIGGLIPRTHGRRGNPGRSKALNGDLWVIEQHKDTGRKIPELVREAQEGEPPRLDPYVEVDVHAKRIRDILKTTDF